MTIGSSAGTALAKICMKEQAADSVVVAEVKIVSFVSGPNSAMRHSSLRKKVYSGTVFTRY